MVLALAVKGFPRYSRTHGLFGHLLQQSLEWSHGEYDVAQVDPTRQYVQHQIDALETDGDNDSLGRLKLLDLFCTVTLILLMISHVLSGT